MWIIWSTSRACFCEGKVNELIWPAVVPIAGTRSVPFRLRATEEARLACWSLACGPSVRRSPSPDPAIELQALQLRPNHMSPTTGRIVMMRFLPTITSRRFRAGTWAPSLGVAETTPGEEEPRNSLERIFCY